MRRTYRKDIDNFVTSKSLAAVTAVETCSAVGQAIREDFGAVGLDPRDFARPLAWMLRKVAENVKVRIDAGASAEVASQFALQSALSTLLRCATAARSSEHPGVFLGADVGTDRLDQLIDRITARFPEQHMGHEVGTAR